MERYYSPKNTYHQCKAMRLEPKKYKIKVYAMLGALLDDIQQS